MHVENARVLAVARQFGLGPRRPVDSIFDVWVATSLGVRGRGAEFEDFLRSLRTAGECEAERHRRDRNQRGKPQDGHPVSAELLNHVDAPWRDLLLHDALSSFSYGACA